MPDLRRHTPLLILAATAAVLLLMAGVYRATRPASGLLTAEEARAELEDLAVRFSAAIENGRDVAPLRGPIEAVVDQRPELRNGRKLLGQLYAHVGDTAMAYDEFAAALSIDPEEPMLQNLAGTAAAMLGDATAAETHHRLAVRQAPDDPALRLPLADLLIEQGRWDEARDVLLGALSIRVTLHEANFLLGEVYVGRGQEGDTALAVGQFEQALAKLPPGKPGSAASRVAYARRLASYYAELGEPREAVAVLDSLPEAARFSPEVLADMAGYLDRQGQAVLAGLQYEIALDREPTNADYAALAAEWYERGGDTRAAALMRARRAEIGPDTPR
ncbi:MAG: tetratricopeptide repeat protein [Planctomycetota bacterium]